MDGSRIAYDVSAEYSRGALQRGLRLERRPRRRRRASAAGRPAAPTTPARAPASASSRWPARAWPGSSTRAATSESGDYLYATLVAQPGRARARVRLPHRRRQRHPDRQLARRPRRRGQLPGRQPLGDGLPRRGHHRQPGAGRRAAERPRTGRGDDDRAVDRRPAARGPARATARSGSTRPGAQLRRTVVPSSAQEVALRGDYLAVLTNGVDARGLQLALGPATAHLARRARRAHLDISSGLRRVSSGRTHVVHVVRLTSGQDRVFGARAAAAVAAVQLEPSGLAYAFPEPGRHRPVVFVPMSRLR